MPLSATRTTCFGILLTSWSDVSRLTAKVFKLRLFTPIASARFRQRIKHPVQLVAGVYFNQHAQQKLSCEMSKPLEFSIGQRGGDEQNRVAMMRTHLNDLVFIYCKILRRQGRGTAAEASSRFFKLP